MNNITVGDLAARIRTRKHIKKSTDRKDVVFKIIDVRGSIVVGEDGNNHYYNKLRHATKDEIVNFKTH